MPQNASKSGHFIQYQEKHFCPIERDFVDKSCQNHLNSRSLHFGSQKVTVIEAVQWLVRRPISSVQAFEAHRGRSKAQPVELLFFFFFFLYAEDSTKADQLNRKGLGWCQGIGKGHLGQRVRGSQAQESRGGKLFPCLVAHSRLPHPCFSCLCLLSTPCTQGGYQP